MMGRIRTVFGLLGIVVGLAACGTGVVLPDPAQVVLDDTIASRAAPGEQWRIQAAERVPQSRLSGDASKTADEVWCVTVEQRSGAGEGPGSLDYYLVYRQGGTWSAAHWAASVGDSSLAAWGSEFCQWSS